MNLTIANLVVRERFGDEEGLRLIKEAGFDGVDYNFCLFSDKTYMLGDDYVERANRIKALLKELDLKCEQTHAPFSLKYGEPFSMDNKNFKDIVRSIEGASIIGAKAIVVHSIATPNADDQIEYNVNYYNTLLPYAKKYGIKIAVENLHSTLNNVERYNSIIRKLDKEYFCGCMDVGHAFDSGYQVDEFVSHIDKNFVSYLHLQDTDGVSDRHWIPYSGNIAWSELIKALKEYGYNGNFNFEIIHCFDNLPNDLILPMLKYAEKVGRRLIKEYGSLS